MKKNIEKIVATIAIILIISSSAVIINKLEAEPSHLAKYSMEFINALGQGDFNKIMPLLTKDSPFRKSSDFSLSEVRKLCVQYTGNKTLSGAFIEGIKAGVYTTDIEYFDDKGNEISYMKAFMNAQKIAEGTDTYRAIVGKYGNAMKEFALKRLRNGEKVDPDTERLANIGYADLAKLNAQYVHKKVIRKVLGYGVRVSIPITGEEQKKYMAPYKEFTVIIDFSIDKDGVFRISDVELPMLPDL